VKHYELEWFDNNLEIIERDENMTAFSAPCKYLHQLQNIIHALTGEELEINL
jgi:hypothetical protein